jgi:hypothetical protein
MHIYLFVLSLSSAINISLPSLPPFIHLSLSISLYLSIHLVSLYLRHLVSKLYGKPSLNVPFLRPLIERHESANQAGAAINQAVISTTSPACMQSQDSTKFFHPEFPRAAYRKGTVSQEHDGGCGLGRETPIAGFLIANCFFGIEFNLNFLNLKSSIFFDVAKMFTKCCMCVV